MPDDDLQQHLAHTATTRWLAVGLALALLSPVFVLMGCDRTPTPGTPPPRMAHSSSDFATHSAPATPAAAPAPSPRRLVAVATLARDER